MDGVHSIETLFDNIFEKLPDYIESKVYLCTHKWKRYYSFFEARKHQGEINHITGDIHTIALFLDKNKTILTVHDIGRLERDLRGLKKRIFKLLWLDLPLKRVKYITTISDFTKKRLVEVCKISPEKIHVIPNPSSNDFTYNQNSYDKKSPCILQMGSGNNKNIYRLIEAIKGTSFRLLLIRKPNTKIKKLLEVYNISFEWKYNISRQQVYECYLKCDIVFFASEYEGFGMPILEANSVGRPVVTSKLSSMPFVAGESALLVNPFSVEEIRASLIKLHNNASLRDKLIAKGLKNLKRFSIERITEQYVELYHEIKRKG